ncbi:MAG: Gp15 family bacteriophage protein [Acinetobacter sp.]
MINFLLDKLPCKDRNGLDIRTDFKTWIAFETMLQNPYNLLSEIETRNDCVELIYKEKPSNYEVAFLELISFNNMYMDISGDDVPKECLFDWVCDGASVYSAFMKTYGIDLITLDYMHWWKFKALFRDIDQNTQLSNAIYYRGIDLSKEKDPKRRSELAKIKSKFVIK